ncbi:LLM class flavin-dependent oxidoreductase [Saliterribacillus persicus]|uniref:Alkanesulfonate monooxygenase SsuD/methylene tetrahydromethanopterin reductase-like flavin-dependent oxidoreductase (Luciferase family) n=1 Tax=Saliterribacillus persicus TaxID=930114 RepID=A0A368Y1B3_9BACI|nr:LLM class flavin-dependent oxidoreductase [Saliterribacillus persicus]RCW72034.1 alkanesulfonate monooxygenase SsuD/methylene tetrahydromethanopterin reductase-like flavin-dependent oxidoreductase (luciferase family) [Saliterribacillus persicus]
MSFEFGIFTLTERIPNLSTKTIPSYKERIDEIVEMGVYAEELGLDIFGVGEHHRLDYAVSSPQMVLAAIAQATKNIRLTAMTTVLNTTDPVRAFEDFATLDLLSNGRAEFTAGRGAFVESFPLFGYDERDYDSLFEEHLELFLALTKNEKITWDGKYRSSLVDAEISPRPIQETLPTWVGVGGTIESAIRAGNYGCHLAVALISGVTIRYQALISAFKDARNSSDQRISLNGHTFIRETKTEIEQLFYPHYANYWKFLSSINGGGQMNVSRTDMKFITSPESSLFVGTPDQIVEKILYQHELFGHDRFVAQVDIGGQSKENIFQTMELLATEVAPKVKEKLKK